jgi:hypothetical protein
VSVYGEVRSFVRALELHVDPLRLRIVSHTSLHFVDTHVPTLTEDNRSFRADDEQGIFLKLIM